MSRLTKIRSAYLYYRVYYIEALSDLLITHEIRQFKRLEGQNESTDQRVVGMTWMIDTLEVKDECGDKRDC